ncbi:MAG: hypothetical protein MUP98_09050 [Candidatus Aminicenantes bacterium]|nr:hypothetical protein [Candidatus Aminicenantes bacterium]
MKNDFGLSHKGNDWIYNGKGALDPKTALKLCDAKMCLGMLNFLRTGNEVEFDQICIVPGKPTLIVCNANPPFGLATTLQPEEAGKVTESLVADKSAIIQYKNAFIVRLRDEVDISTEDDKYSCPSCGTIVAENSMICIGCGRDINW